MYRRLVAAGLVSAVLLAGCTGAGSDTDSTAADESNDDGTAAVETTPDAPATPQAAPTPQEASTTAPEETVTGDESAAVEPTPTPDLGPPRDGIADLRLVGLDDTDLAMIDDGYRQVFASIDAPAGDPNFLPWTCGGPFEYEAVHRRAFGYVYPINELGVPDAGVLYDIVHVAHQVGGGGEAGLAADIGTLTADPECSVTFDRGNFGPVEALGSPVDAPRLDGIDEASGFALPLDDANTYLQYAFTADDLGAVLLMVGSAPGGLEDLQALAVPIVETAQRSLVECLESAACRNDDE